MKVTVVVPVLNGRDVIPGCIGALLQQTHQPDAVYAVDNGSTDGTFEWLQEQATGEPRLRVLRELRRGQAAARNAALQHLDDGVVAFTDADCVPERTWLEELLKPYAHPGVGATAGYIAGYMPRNLIQRYLSIVAFVTPDDARIVRKFSYYAGAFSTASLSIRADILREIGGFDDGMPPSDDVDICCRLLRAGWWIGYTPQARVAHIHRATLGRMLRRQFEYGMGTPRLLAKNCRGEVHVLAAGRLFEWRGPITLCVNLTSPEKIVLGLIALTAAAHWFFPLLMAAWALFAVRVARRAARRGVAIKSPVELAVMAVLYVLDPLAMNMGSLRTSLAHRVLCV